MGQALKNNQKPSFIRLWKWDLLRLNQSSLKPKALIAIGVELSGLKGKIASALEKNEKLAPIAIGVELWLQLKTEGADREEIEAKRSSLKENFAPVAEHSQKLTHDMASSPASRKKSKADLADLEVILEILQSWGDKTLQLSLDKVAAILQS